MRLWRKRQIGLPTIHNRPPAPAMKRPKPDVTSKVPTIYWLEKHWDDYQAREVYVLRDDRKVNGQFLPPPRRQGDYAWAQTISEHYKIAMPDEPPKSKRQRPRMEI